MLLVHVLRFHLGIAVLQSEFLSGSPVEKCKFLLHNQSLVLVLYLIINTKDRKEIKL